MVHEFNSSNDFLFNIVLFLDGIINLNWLENQNNWQKCF